MQIPGKLNRLKMAIETKEDFIQKGLDRYPDEELSAKKVILYHFRLAIEQVLLKSSEKFKQVQFHGVELSND
jgi:hypothetical protein